MSPVHNSREVRSLSDRGFTLIELLIAMAIFAVGMLALADLQGQGLMYNSNAYERTQAILLASDMADRIRANVTSAGPNPAYGGITSPPGAAASCVGVTCSPAAMVAADAFEWLTLVGQILPGGTGSVAVAGGIYTITVSWTGRFGPRSHALRVRP